MSQFEEQCANPAQTAAREPTGYFFSKLNYGNFGNHGNSGNSDTPALSVLFNHLLTTFFTARVRLKLKAKNKKASSYGLLAGRVLMAGCLF